MFVRSAVLLLCAATASCAHASTQVATPSTAAAGTIAERIVYIRCYDSESLEPTPIVVSYQIVSYPSGGALISCSVSDAARTSSWTVARPAPEDGETIDTRCTVTHDTLGEHDSGFWSFELQTDPAGVLVEYIDVGEAPLSFPMQGCGSGEM